MGILVPENYSKYATPIVPILKDNGKVRFFRYTLYRLCDIDKYPLPRT